jgi:predicted NAD/FAD-binding protein
MKKVAVIGSGISGTSAAYYLNKLGYDVYLFESGSHFGGHTHTIDLEFEGQRMPVDTGFLGPIIMTKKTCINGHSLSLKF